DAVLCAGHARIGAASSPDAARAGRQKGAPRQLEVAQRAQKSLRELLAERLEAHADVLIDRLLRIAQTGDDADARRAIEAMLSRVYGRPKDTVEHRVDPARHIIDMSPEERAEPAVAIARRRALLELQAAA